MVVYEWADSKYLGKVTDPSNDYLPVSDFTHFQPALGNTVLKMWGIAEDLRLHIECGYQWILYSV